MNAIPNSRFISHNASNCKDSGKTGDKINYGGPLIVQIFQLIKGKDLYAHLYGDFSKKSDKVPLRKDRTISYLKYLSQACYGLHELHSKEIYHSDVKPENIMINEEKDEAVLIDLDFATKTSSPRMKRGTLRYLAPEYVCAYRGHIEMEGLCKYGAAYDMWAIGAILWVVIYGGMKNFCFTQYTPEAMKASALTSKNIQALLTEKEWTKYCKKRIPEIDNLDKKSEKEYDVMCDIRQLIIDLTQWAPDARPSAISAAEKLQSFYLKLQKI